MEYLRYFLNIINRIIMFINRFQVSKGVNFLADYKRMVSYMYQYEKGVKKKNVGFARIEIRGGQIKLTLHMQLLGQLDSIFPTYLIQRDKDGMELIYLGDSMLKSQVMDSKLIANENNVMESGYNFSAFSGILLFLNEDIFYATQWDERPIVAREVMEALNPNKKKSVDKKVSSDIKEEVQEFSEVEKKEDFLEEALFQKKQTEEASVPDQTSIPTYKLPGGYKFIEAFRNKQAGQLKGASEGILKTDKADIQKPFEEALSNNKLPEEEKEQKKTILEESKQKNMIEKEVAQGETRWEEAKQNEVLKEKTKPEETKQEEVVQKETKQEETKQKEPIQEEINQEKMVQKDTLQRTMIHKSIDQEEAVAQNDIKVEDTTVLQDMSEDALASENIDYEADIQEKLIKEAARQHEDLQEQFLKENMFQEELIQNTERNEEEVVKAGKGQPGSQKEENCQESTGAARIFNHYPRIYPFEDNEITMCVKIEPKDIGYLPMSVWGLSNNSFLLHGFYCYHHLIFAKMVDHYGSRYIIGVPGIYHSREQFMARMFGFESFKSIRKRDLRQGDFGYWYLAISM